MVGGCPLSSLPPSLPAVSLRAGAAAAAAIPRRPSPRPLISGAGQEVGGGDGRPVLPIASRGPCYLLPTSFSFWLAPPHEGSAGLCLGLSGRSLWPSLAPAACFFFQLPFGTHGLCVPCCCIPSHSPSVLLILSIGFFFFSSTPTPAAYSLRLQPFSRSPLLFPIQVQVFIKHLLYAKPWILHLSSFSLQGSMETRCHPTSPFNPHLISALCPCHYLLAVQLPPPLPAPHPGLWGEGTLSGPCPSRLYLNLSTFSTFFLRISLLTHPR